MHNPEKFARFISEAASRQESAENKLREVVESLSGVETRRNPSMAVEHSAIQWWAARATVWKQAGEMRNLEQVSDKIIRLSRHPTTLESLIAEIDTWIQVRDVLKRMLPTTENLLLEHLREALLAIGLRVGSWRSPWEVSIGHGSIRVRFQGEFVDVPHHKVLEASRVAMVAGLGSKASGTDVLEAIRGCCE